MSLCKMLGDWQTLFYIKPFWVVYILSPFYRRDWGPDGEEMNCQGHNTSNKWQSQHANPGTSDSKTLAFCLLRYAVNSWMNGSVSRYSRGVPNYFLQRENALPKMNPSPKTYTFTFGTHYMWPFKSPQFPTPHILSDVGAESGFRII